MPSREQRESRHKCEHITGTTLIYLSFLDRSSPLRREGRSASGCTCMLVCAFLCAIAHETAGAARTRHSLRPLFLEGRRFSKPRAHRAARIAKHIHVIARSECERSNPLSRSHSANMDCFASPRNDGSTMHGRASAHQNGLLKNLDPFNPYRHGRSTALVIPIRTPATISGLPSRACSANRRRIERQLAVLDGDAERLAEFAGPGTQRALVVQAAAAAHRRQCHGSAAARGSARRWPSLPFRRRNSRTNGCRRSGRRRKSPADRTSPCCAASAR